MWVIPLLALDEGPASADPAPGESWYLQRATTACTVLSPPCRPCMAIELTPEDGDRLVAALTDAGTHASLEAAAAIRWGEAMDVPVDDLEPELCRAILDVLDRASTDLEPLRERLSREAAPPQRRTRLIRSIHNPRRRACGCLDDCWCKRTALGTRHPLVRPAEAPQLRVAMLEAELAEAGAWSPTGRNGMPSRRPASGRGRARPDA